MRPLFLSIILFTFSGEISQAASILISDESGCSIQLRGEIVNGDAERLLNAIYEAGLDFDPEVRTDGNPPYEKGLCLDSPGGDFIESRIISELVERFGITTRVRSDSSCLSSCAFVFMAGRWFGLEFDQASRVMDVGARIGFHAPYFSPKTAIDMSGDEVSKLLIEYNLLLSNFIRSGLRRSSFEARNSFSNSLLAEVLSTPPEDLRMIETIEDAERWGIVLGDNGTLAGFSNRELSNICNNFQNWWRDDRSNIREEYEHPTQLIELEGRQSGKELFYRVDTGGMFESFCLIKLNVGPVLSYDVCSFDGFSLTSLGACPDSPIQIPSYYSLDPRTPISSLE